MARKMTGWNLYIQQTMCQTRFTACINKHWLFPSLAWEHYISWSQFAKQLHLTEMVNVGLDSTAARTCFVEKWENPQSVRTREEGWEIRGFAGEKKKTDQPLWKLWPRQQISVFLNSAELHILDVSTPTLGLCASIWAGFINQGW